MDQDTVISLLLSIAILTALTVASKFSRPLSAILVTMPLKVTLGMYIVATTIEPAQTALVEFTGGLFPGLLGLLAFIIIARIVIIAGWSLVPTLAVGYAAWAVTVGGFYLVRSLFFAPPPV